MPVQAPNPGDDQPIILTTAPTTSACAQIIYGLELRGIGAKAIDNPAKSRDAFAILLTKGDKKAALNAIEIIWDMILESTPRATDMDGGCFYCGYNTTGLPAPAICPECGHELDTIQARRQASEGRFQG